MAAPHGFRSAPVGHAFPVTSGATLAVPGEAACGSKTEDTHLRRIIPLALSLVLLAMVLPGAVSAAKPGSGAGVTTPVPGTIANAGGAFNGALTLTKVARQNGQLVGTGTLTGTLTDALGGVLGSATQAVTLPLQASGTCAILHLTLGPLDLNLLGLLVHLNQVVLNIDAQSGPGNLLGNLLCAVAGLLDGSGGLGGISAILNQILNILSGLNL